MYIPQIDNQHFEGIYLHVHRFIIPCSFINKKCFLTLNIVNLFDSLNKYYKNISFV